MKIMCSVELGVYWNVPLQQCDVAKSPRLLYSTDVCGQLLCVA